MLNIVSPISGSFELQVIFNLVDMTNESCPI